MLWLTPPATLTPFTENKSNLRKTYIITKLSIPPAKLYIRLAKFPNVNPTRIILTIAIPNAAKGLYTYSEKITTIFENPAFIPGIPIFIGIIDSI